MATHFRQCILFGLLLVLNVNQSDAQLNLPTQPNAWLNSPVITNRALAGKGAFIWFFEEDCPRCRDKWPAMYALAQKYQGEPILFMAVNSGNSRAEVQRYAQQVQLGWPIIVDSTRQFETEAGVGEISLQNIHQVGIINGKGEFQQGSWSDLESSVQSALRGAAWKVPPEEVPSTLRKAWVAVEFGDYGSAAPLIKRYIRSGKTDVREAANKLNDAVLNTAETTLVEARKALSADEKWKAYLTFSRVSEEYADYELPADVEENLESLSNDDQIKLELKAQKALGLIERTLSNARARRGNMVRLEKLMEEYPDTAAAEQAQIWLDQLQSL